MSRIVSRLGEKSEIKEKGMTVKCRMVTVVKFKWAGKQNRPLKQEYVECVCMLVCVCEMTI